MKFLVHQNGDVVYSLAGRAIIRDHGNTLHMLQTDRESIETGLRLAQEKFGQTITLSGPKEFQERTARIAAEAGLKVTFADSKLDKMMQLRASALASGHAKKKEYRELASKFIEGQKAAISGETKAQEKSIAELSKSTPKRNDEPER